jgi:AcrR family transcriptional regulator
MARRLRDWHEACRSRWLAGYPMTESAPVEPERADPLHSESVGSPHVAAALPHDGPLRDRVLEATAALVREAGAVDRITMRRLAKRLRTSTTALYSEFPSKRVLLAAARQRALLELREHLDAALANGDAFVALRTWIECYASRGYADPWVAGLLTTDPGASGNDEIRAAADLIGLSGLQRAIDEIDGRGGLAPGVSATSATWLLWSGAHSLLVLCDVVAQHDDEAARGPLVRRLAAAIVGGVTARKAPAVFDGLAPSK